MINTKYLALIVGIDQAVSSPIACCFKRYYLNLCLKILISIWWTEGTFKGFNKLFNIVVVENDN